VAEERDRATPGEHRRRLTLRRPHHDPRDEDMPRVHITREQKVALVIFTLSAIAFLYFVLPKLAGLKQTWHRVERGKPGWLALGAGFEVCSFVGYVVLFRCVFVRRERESPIGWRASYEITMAGLAATRLFAAGGAGGVALTAWALRRAGMAARIVACRMVAFNILLYTVYMGSLVIAGVGLQIGLFPGGGSFAITMIPAIFGVVALAVVYGVALRPRHAERVSRRLAPEPRGTRGPGRLHRLLVRIASVPALIRSGSETAVELARARDPGLLGAPAWWGFDILTLWASFHAFGHPPPLTVIWMAYFVGMFANLLPIPGGIGGVDGGMIGALLAFGVHADLAVVSVLVYRGFAFWLPTAPGAVAYLQLRRTVRRWREQGLSVETAPAPA
jgi:uncharacterized membrane protein YbhN (UPF0104 family)